MVKIRLTRIGKRNHASFRLGVYDARTRRDGRSIEMLGFYDPHALELASKFKFDVERAKYWISVGAQPTEKVEALLRQAGIEIVRKPRKKRKKPAGAKKSPGSGAKAGK